MSEKEPTQPKIDEKTQHRLSDIDAELYIFKQKAKGDAKNNLKLVEMERAKELILEKRELMGEYVKPWDVKKGVTEEDWMDMYDYLEVQRSNMQWWDYPVQVARMMMLDPDLHIEIKDNEHDGMEERLESEINANAWWNVAFLAAHMKIIDQNLDIPLTKNRWIIMTEELENLSRRYDVSAYLKMAANMKIIYPTKDLRIAETKLEELKEEFKSLENDLLANWAKAVELAKNIKIIDPKWNPKIAARYWNRMKESLNHRRENKDTWALTELAVAMKILAAKSVKVTNKGIELGD